MSLKIVRSPTLERKKSCVWSHTSEQDPTQQGRGRRTQERDGTWRLTQAAGAQELGSREPWVAGQGGQKRGRWRWDRRAPTSLQWHLQILSSGQFEGPDLTLIFPRVSLPFPLEKASVVLS